MAHPHDDESRLDPLDDTLPSEEEIAAFDLDGDGEISLVEQERARLGVVDARLEQIAEGGGVTGKIAGALHKVVDKLDED